jgi:uncharacterized protein
MIHQETEVRFIDSEVGYGVFAKTFISRGTITWVKDQLDREFTAEDLKTFDTAHRELLDRYSYRNARGHYVFCWDHARFMNHSAQPTCLLTPYGLEIAIRDIAPGEELTNDYGCFNIIEPFSPKAEDQGRTTVFTDDLSRFSETWDSEIAAALAFLTQVDQPLCQYLAPDIWQEVRQTAAGELPPRSTFELLFQESD